MREIEVLNGPCGFVAGGLTALSFPEEDQLESEPVSARGGHVTGVIPPFRAKVLVLEMVARKPIRITGQRLAVLEATAEQRENTERNCEPCNRYPQRPAYRSLLATMRLPSMIDGFDQWT